MSITQNLSITWAGSGGAAAVGANVSLSSDLEHNLSTTVPGSTSNQSESIGFTKSKLQMFFAMSDQSITLKTNSSGASNDTISLSPNYPMTWYAGCGSSIPFVGDVTTMFLTNAGSTSATVNVRILESS